MPPVTTTEHVGTADGWTLALHRWVPAASERRLAADGAPPCPVVLLHGFGANGFCFHDPAGHSLGRHLAQRGVEAWIPELRGTRSSVPPERARRPLPRRQQLRAVTIADKLALDLPAVLAHVLVRSGSSQLDAVGHSLGGTLLFAHLARTARPTIRRCVGIAAAARYPLSIAARGLSAAHRAHPAWLPLPDPLPLRRLCILGAQTRIIAPAHEHFNVANVEREVLLRMMRWGVEDPSLRELSELGSGAARPEGTTLPIGGSRSPVPTQGAALLQGLGRVRAPLLLVGGSRDRHVSEASLREVLDAWGATAKRLRMIGRATGAPLDYGHTDLLLGARARTEVFPLVVDWLTSPSDDPSARASEGAGEAPAHP